MHVKCSVCFQVLLYILTQRESKLYRRHIIQQREREFALYSSRHITRMTISLISFSVCEIRATCFL